MPEVMIPAAAVVEVGASRQRVLRRRLPRMIGHPSEWYPPAWCEDHYAEVEGREVMVMVPTRPKPDDMRNPGAEALLGWPVFGDVLVGSGSDEHLDWDVAAAVMRIAVPQEA